MKTILFVLLLVLPAWTLAADAPDARAPVPPDIDPATLTESTRAALVKAVDYIRKQAEKDEEGWVVPPIRQKKAVDYKDVTVRYANKTYREPVYEYETYEAYERKMGDDSVSSKQLVKVTKTRIKRQIGTREVTQLMPDPNGPVVKTVKQPIWGPGGPDYWGAVRLGQNGLALFALRAAGVPPDDAVVSRLAANVANFVEQFGAPDTTFDLACVTAALAACPADQYQRVARSLAGKILDGQIPDGKAAGLWGPVCINTHLLASALRYEQLLSKTRDAAKLAVEKRESAAARKALDKAEAALLQIQHDILQRISISAPADDKIDYQIDITPDGRDPLILAGLPHYIFNQNAADLESTAYALWALRVATMFGALPAETWRPTVNDRPIFAPEKTASILARAANVLADAQLADGGWDEMNRHQPVTDFNGMAGIDGVPLKPTRFPALDSRSNALSAWQGCQALLGAGHAIGIDRFLAKLATPAQRASDRSRKLAEGLIDGSVKDDAIGSRVPPYDAALFLAGLNRAFLTAREDRRDLYLRLAAKFVAEQGQNGSWGPLYPSIALIPTSLRARLDCKDPAMRATPDAPPRATCHTLLGWGQNGSLIWRYICYGKNSPLFKAPSAMTANQYYADKLIHTTACSVILLADGLRPPAAGDCSWSAPASGPDLLPAALDHVRQKTRVAFAYAPVPRDLPVAVMQPLPALVVRGAGPFDPAPEAKESLKSCLTNGGLILVVASTDEPGAKFLKDARAALEPLVKDAAVKDIAGDADTFGELANKVTVEAVISPKGLPAVVFLPITKNSQPEKAALTEAQAASVAAELILRRIPADLVKESYPAALAAPAPEPEPKAKAD